MDRNTAKERIKQQILCTEFLQQSGRNKAAIFARFAAAATQKGTGALKPYTDTNTWTCYACGKNGDVIDLYTRSPEQTITPPCKELAAQIGWN